MTEPSTPRTIKTRRIPLAAIVTGVVVTAFLVPWFLFIIWRSGISRDIEQLESEVRAAGEPLTLAELGAREKPPPESENVILGLIAVWEKEDPYYWKTVRSDSPSTPSPKPLPVPDDFPLFGRDSKREQDFRPWSAVRLSAVQEFMRTNAARDLTIRQALERPQSYLAIDQRLDGPGSFPHLSFLKQEARRLQLHLLLGVNEGDPQAILRSTRLLLRLADSVGKDPFIISQLVRFAILRMTFDGLETALTDAKLADADLAGLEQMIATLDLRRATYQALLGERVSGLRFFHTPIGDMASTSSQDPASDSRHDQLFGRLTISQTPFNAVGWFALDRRLMLRTYNQVISLAREGDWNKILKTESVLKRAQVEANAFPKKFVSGMLLPSENAIHRHVDIEAHRRCALAAIRLERYRCSHEGKLPESKDLGVDPFDGNPLRFRTLPHGYAIYSIGPDRVDQQGVRKLAGGRSESFDIPFTVGPEPKRTE